MKESDFIDTERLVNARAAAAHLDEFEINFEDDLEADLLRLHMEASKATRALVDYLETNMHIVPAVVDV